MKELTEKVHANPYDLLIIPQRNVRLTAPHLTAEQAVQVQADWRAFANCPPPDIEHGSWWIAAAHLKGDSFEITSIMSIPRRAVSTQPQASSAARAAS